jgi:hypothetical protein
VCLVVCVGGIAATAAVGASTSGLTGAWSGTYGGAYHGTFKLHWTQTGSKLHGSIKISYSGQSATTSVTGKMNGSAISFGAVGPAGVVTYTGSVSGTSMSGNYTTRGGSGTWSAHKTSS